MTQLATKNINRRINIDIKTILKLQISDRHEQELLWKIYRETFEGNNTCSQDQMCYNRRSFIDALVDIDYLKFILFHGQTPVGLSLVTNDLEKARISYMNPNFFKQKYPVFYKQKKLFYVTVLSIENKMKGLKCIKTLLSHMIHYIIDHDSMVTFDFSENKNGLLPEIIKLVGQDLKIPISGQKLDAQVYFELHGSNNSAPA